jgi:hypothetical protein
MALLAVVASLGLVSLAYGVGGLVGGGAAGAAASAPSSVSPAGPSRGFQRDVAAQHGATRPHHHCPHMDGGGSGSSGSSSGTSGTDSPMPSGAQAY